MYGLTQFYTRFTNAIPKDITLDKLLELGAIANFYSKNYIDFTYLDIARNKIDHSIYTEEILTEISVAKELSPQLQTKIIAKYIFGLGMDIQLESKCNDIESIFNVCLEFLKNKTRSDSQSLTQIVKEATFELSNEEEARTLLEPIPPSEKIKTEQINFVQIQDLKTKTKFSRTYYCNDCISYKKCNRTEPADCDVLDTFKCIIDKKHIAETTTISDSSLDLGIQIKVKDKKVLLDNQNQLIAIKNNFFQNSK